MKTKQTAVDWLFLMLNNLNRDQEFAKKLLNKAKEIEKKQIMDAYNDGIEYEISIYSTIDAEEYYNETYGKD